MNERLKTAFSSVARLTRRWKLLTVRKIIYLPHILSHQEKKVFSLLAGIVILTSAGLGVRAYVHFTHPVPAVGGTYTEGIISSPPRTINPIYLSRDTDRDIARLVFSGLITYDGAGNPVPDLAERYEISPDGRTYTFFLRKDVRWHDGIPLGADDVVFTINRIQNPQYKSPARVNWQGVEVQKIDGHTVRFVLRTPYSPFLENLTQGIVPKHLWENIDPAQAVLHDLNMHPVGSGPYQFSRFKSTGEGAVIWYALSRNPNYYREGPYLQTVTFLFFNSEDEAVAALHKGEIDGYGPVSSSRAADTNQNRQIVLNTATPRIFSIFFNQHAAPALADHAVREAIMRGIDRAKIAEQGVGGAIVIDSILAPFQKEVAPGAAAGGGSSAYDPQRAGAILDAAGWKDTDGDGIRDKKMRGAKGKAASSTLRFTLTTGDSPELVAAAQMTKTMLADIGIEADVDVKSFADLGTSVIRPRAFEMLLFGQVYGYEPDPFAFWHSSQIKDPGLNIALFADKNADKILESARHTTDRAIRNQKYAEFSALVARAIPAVPLYTQLYRYLLPRDLRFAASEDNPIARIALPADRFNEINRWYRTTRRAF